MKTFKNYFNLLIIVLTFMCLTLNAQIIEKKTVSLELAKKIALACELEAAKNNWTMVVAVVDDGGNLVYLQRMNNAQIGSIEVAIKKAQTAIYFKRPTKTYEERVTGGNNAILSLPNVIPFEGGLPLIIDGQYVGALGVSGGSAPQDGVVAKAGADIILTK